MCIVLRRGLREEVRRGNLRVKENVKWENGREARGVLIYTPQASTSAGDEGCSLILPRVDNRTASFVFGALKREKGRKREREKEELYVLAVCGEDILM